jgi:hypothetical protein
MCCSSVRSQVLVGGCRNAGDAQRVGELKTLAEKLNITAHVDFEVNLPFENLLEYFAVSQFGLHTMWNEHFGICVVELMVISAFASVVCPFSRNHEKTWSQIFVSCDGCVCFVRRLLA